MTFLIVIIIVGILMDVGMTQTCVYDGLDLNALSDTMITCEYATQDGIYQCMCHFCVSLFNIVMLHDIYVLFI